MMCKDCKHLETFKDKSVHCKYLKVCTLDNKDSGEKEKPKWTKRG